MTQKKSLEKVLQQVLHEEQFEKLTNFYDEALWQDLETEQQKLLAKLFVTACEKSSDTVLFEKSVQAVERLAADNAFLWHRLGGILQNHNLEKAIFCFKKAAKQDPAFFAAYFAWAEGVFEQAKQKASDDLLEEAGKIFEQAEGLIDNAYDSRSVAEFYYKRGTFAFASGRLSGEAGDLRQAIEYYQKAKECGEKSSALANDLANALVELGVLINKEEFIFEAINLYELSIKDTQEDPEALGIRYNNLASCYRVLFEMHKEHAFFENANEAYAKAHEHNKSLTALFEEWGRLLFSGAMFWKDVLLLEACVQKYTEALKSLMPTARLVASLARALALLGVWREELVCIGKAEELLQEHMPQFEKEPDIWAAFGVCLYEKGKYFDDRRYFVEAIEKVEQAIIYEDDPLRYLYLLATMTASLAYTSKDFTLFQKAIDYFEEAEEAAFSSFANFWHDWGTTLMRAVEVVPDVHYIEESIEKFEMMLELQKHVPVEWLYDYSTALVLLGNLIDEEICYSKAIDILEYAMIAYPDNIHVRSQLAFAYSRAGELMEDQTDFYTALSLYEEVLREDPEDDCAYNEMGLVYIHLTQLGFDDEKASYAQNFELAEYYFTKARLLGNEYAFYNLACLYALQGQTEKAMPFLKKAYQQGVLSSVDDILDDDWLSNLIETDECIDLLQQIAEKSTKENSFE